MEERSGDEFNLIDVRQPGEYETCHIPGAKLIPIAELDRPLDEIDPSKPTLLYWASGVRSRVAAQMLSGKGFNDIINVAGGIKACNGLVDEPAEQYVNGFDGTQAPFILQFRRLDRIAAIEKP